MHGTQGMKGTNGTQGIHSTQVTQGTHGTQVWFGLGSGFGVFEIISSGFSSGFWS